MTCNKHISFWTIILMATVCMADVSENNTPTIVPTQTVETKKDEIELKQEEMLETSVLVRTNMGSGSGTLIKCLETDAEGTFEYIVLTNAHVVRTRFVRSIDNVNSVTGKVTTKTIDPGCTVITFDHKQVTQNENKAKIIGEDISLDLCLISFTSTQKLAVARLASDQMFSDVRVFDSVFIISCQLSLSPTPTFGIISKIGKRFYGKRQFISYMTTSQITPGSSGGGLFKKYDNHYYLIGIPYSIYMTRNRQLMPHLTNTIPLSVAIDFINSNAMSR